MGIVILPAVRQTLGKGPQMKGLMDAIQRRLSGLVYVSIVGLVITGLLMSNRSPAFQGLFSLGNAYSMALTLVRSQGLRQRQGPQPPPQEKLSAALLFLNIALGILILLLSGWIAALSAAPPA